MATLVWFRHDLRLADNAALAAACASGEPVVPLFIWAPEEEAPWAPGSAGRWWLGRSLVALDARLRDAGSRLVVRAGGSLDELREVARATGARTVRWNRRLEPAFAQRDARVAAALRADGLAVEQAPASLLVQPEAMRTSGGGPFRVFTPFWNALLARQDLGATLPAPARIAAPPRWPASHAVEDLALGSKAAWSDTWTPGEAAAQESLATFIDEQLARYPAHRDRPDIDGTSRLSPHLRFGEIGPRQAWRAVSEAAGLDARLARPAESFLRQLAWREFSYHLLHHFPHTPQQPLRPAFARFAWRRDDEEFAAWREGRTGFPIVDAGMRQLASTGWMHNRVRMVVGSFLVKDLLLPWIDGARWFWEALVDADLACNTLNWQWVAGCGADAAPYFRILNPVLQARKFDPDGAYTRRWVPEPGPAIVDHALARDRALAAFRRIRKE
ncbi:MAG: deoxyribodipyrimidine photo-lyase [Acidobacteria bacterium]|nr:deoxyribodipyrimidine photo-lyase [Acidobacteriota bacterium]